MLGLAPILARSRAKRTETMDWTPHGMLLASPVDDHIRKTYKNLSETLALETQSQMLTIAVVTEDQLHRCRTNRAF